MRYADKVVIIIKQTATVLTHEFQSYFG